MGTAWSARDLETAHPHACRNREEIGRSDRCGCYYCYATFTPSAIEEWVEDWVEEGPLRCRDLKPATALCPRCDVDAVLGDACGFPVTDISFLRAMHTRWF